MDKIQSKDVFDVEHREKFESILDEFGVDKDEVCIIGSSILALADIRQNRDIDFVTTYDTRERIRNHIESSNKGYKIKSNGAVKFGSDVGLTYTDRFKMFGVTDDEIVRNSEYHVVVDGFKILRPEMEISIKYYRNKIKDKQDILHIEENFVGCNNWDWEVVHVVPPWDKTPNRNSMISRASDAYRREGLIYVIYEGTELFSSKIIPKKILGFATKIGGKVESLRKHPRQSTEYNTLGINELLGNQYRHGKFARDDIMAAFLVINEKVKVNELSIFDNLENSSNSNVTITPDGLLVDGMWSIAELLSKVDIENLNHEVPELEVEIQNRDPKPPRTEEWTKSNFPPETAQTIIDHRNTLLESLGTTFYAFLWPAAADHFDWLETQIRKEGNIISTTDFSNITQFDRVVRDLYSVDKRTDDWRIGKKIHELKKYEGPLRVVTFELPNPEFKPNEQPRLSKRAQELKSNCRKELYTELDNYVFDIILHITDNYKQNRHAAQVVNSIRSGKYD